MPVAPPTHFDDVPIYWFAKLERAVEDSNFAEAAEAQKRLERLGVLVRFVRPTPPKQPKLYEVAHG